jgi:hypothetical protein
MDLFSAAVLIGLALPQGAACSIQEQMFFVSKGMTHAQVVRVLGIKNKRPYTFSGTHRILVYHYSFGDSWELILAYSLGFQDDSVLLERAELRCDEKLVRSAPYEKNPPAIAFERAHPDVLPSGPSPFSKALLSTGTSQTRVTK